MESIIAIISTVAPGVVSVLGIIASVLIGGYKLVKAINDFRSEKDKLIEELRTSDTQYKKYIMELVAQNKELAEKNAALTDYLAHVKGYSATHKKEV
jgi:hypothetical protein